MDASAERVRAVLGEVSLEEAVLAFLLSVLPLAVPLFGLEPLHGSAVAMEGGALAVLGRSGWGKSSVADRLVARGYPFLADDAVAMDGDGRLWPGPPLMATRGDQTHFPVMGAYSGKRVLRTGGVLEGPLLVRAVAVLAPSPEGSPGSRRLEGAEAVTALLTHARAPMVLKERRRAGQLRVASALASVPVDEVSYRPGLDSPDDVAAEILARHAP